MSKKSSDSSGKNTSDAENQEITKPASGKINTTSGSKNKYEEKFFVDTSKPVWNYSLFTEDDIKNFQQGTHYSLYKVFGNKQLTVLNTAGTYFAVWAPNATQVSVTGNFNDWNKEVHILYL